MKKIVTTVVVALAAITTFGACEYVKPDTAWVYKWKFTGKTTYGTSSKSKVAAGMCGYPGGTCVVRSPASLKIEGYTWVCSPGCGSEGFETFSEVNEVFWCKKPVKASFAGGIATEICNIIGKKADKCEIAGTATFNEFCKGDVPGGIYEFTYAGIGKYDKRNSRVKSASGNFAGVLKNPVVIENCSGVPTGVWSCDSLSLLCDEKPSVVYGKWSVKLQKSASKKYAKNGQLPKFPAWAKMKNLEDEDASADDGEQEP